MSELIDNFSLCKDLDPDVNFYSQAINCEYYSEGSFNKMLAENLNLNSNHSNLNNNAKLSLLHLTIRSISRKLDNFTNFLGSLALNFSIIGLTETWLDNSIHLSDIEGYNFIHNPRCERVGGGVGIYLSKHLEFKNRTDLAFISDCAESHYLLKSTERKKKT